MSQKPAPTPPPSRPNLVDYFLLLVGFALSVYLTRVGPLQVVARDSITDSRLRAAISYLPDFMRLPEGVILLGPLFLGVQRVLGRKQGFTSVEWLWVLSWVGVLFLSILTGCVNGLGSPNALQPYVTYFPALWYLILATTMAALAVVLLVLGLLSRQTAPWTHAFGAALIIWSGVLALAILAVGYFKPWGIPS